MNKGSPLTKDQKIAKAVKDDFGKKAKNKISSGTAKKILKASGATIGIVETDWLNRYMDNRVRGESLPLSFLSNDLYAEICRTYGKGAAQFIERIVTDFKRENGIVDEIPEEEVSESTSSHDEKISCTEDNVYK